MASLQRIPGGLLDLIGAETQGRLPGEYSEVVIPSVGLDQLFYAQTRTAVTLQYTSSAVGSGIQLDVPAGEHWIVRAVGWKAIFPGTPGNNTETVEFTAERFPRAAPDVSLTNIQVPMAISDRLEVAQANDIAGYAEWLASPAVFGPGTRLAVRTIARDGGANRTASAYWILDRLQA